MNNLLGGIGALGAQLKPLAKNIEVGFGQAKQYAQEKLGTAEDITELPPEYVALERKIDAIRGLLASLLKTYGHTQLVPQAVTETVTDLSKTLRSSMAALSGHASNEQLPQQSQPETPKTAQHELSKHCNLFGDALGQEPLGAAAKKFAATQERIGDAELNLNSEKDTKFVKPIAQILNERIAEASKARRNVTSARLTLDSVKSRFKSANPQRAEALQVELEKAEDVFVDAVEEASKHMKGIVESPAILRHISDLVALQLAYHKQCVHILSELAPEIDEMQVTQEALYSTSKLG